MADHSLSRRRFLATAVALTGASLLAACTGAPAAPPAPTTAPQSNAGTTQPTATTAAPAAAATPTKPAAAAPTPTAVAQKPEVKSAKVSFLINGGDAEKNAWNARRDVLRKHYPQYDVAVEVVPQDYNNKLLALLAAGTPPDTYRVGTLSDYVPKKLILSLEKYIKNDPDLAVDDMIPGTLDRGRYKGEFYAMPGGLGPQVTFFNVKHFKDAGIPTPREQVAKNNWNFDTFLEAAQKLTQKDASGKVTRFGYTHYQPYWEWAIANAGNAQFSKDYSESYMDKPENYEAIQYAGDLNLKHHVAPNASEQQVFGTWQGFLKGNYSMFISGPWQQGRIGPTMADPWDIAMPPIQKNGKPMMNAGPGGEVVSAQTKEPDAAWKWIVMSDGSSEGQAIWAGLGFDLPNLKTVLDNYIAGKYFTDPKIKPDNIQLWKDIIPNTVPNPDAFLPNKANDEFNNAFGRVIGGQASAKDALTEAVQRANPILKQAASL